MNSKYIIDTNIAKCKIEDINNNTELVEKSMNTEILKINSFTVNYDLSELGHIAIPKDPGVINICKINATKQSYIFIDHEWVLIDFLESIYLDNKFE